MVYVPSMDLVYIAALLHVTMRVHAMRMAVSPYCVAREDEETEYLGVRR